MTTPTAADLHQLATTVSIPVEEATSQAAAAASQLAHMTPHDRASLLDAVATALDAAIDDLVAVADEETALGEARLRGEVARTTGQLRLFGEVLRDGAYLEATIDHADPDTTPPRPDVRRYLVPLGPVAVFTASNFPFAFSVAGGDTASALAAGCPVVVKAHSGHVRLSRLTAAVVRDALAAAGAPEGTLTHVEGRQTGRDLVTSPRIRAVGFTGSLSGGRALFDLATGREDPIPFYGELGSINPVVITEGAAASRPAELAEGLTGSFTLGVGQFCTKPGVVFVPKDADLTKQVAELVADQEPATMLIERICQAFADGTAELATVPGVEVVAGDPAQAGDGAAAPVVFATDTNTLLEDPSRLLEEHFGPAVLLVRYDSQEALDASLHTLPGSLTASLHATPDEYDDLGGVIATLQSLSGRMILDGWPTGVAVTWSMHHGGPWPATTNPLHTSVGTAAIRRFLRPITLQGMPPALQAPAVHDDNPWNLPRRVDGRLEL